MDKQSFKARYDILVRDGRLGGGAFGTVYKAYDNDTDEWMAIKVAELKVIDGKEYSLITEYEATKAVALHRNIANYKAVHQFVESNGVFDYAVMQYYPEGNLKQLTARENLSAIEKKDIAEGIIRGVHHLHRHGILHRDLKPSNILISKTPRGRFIPKIADFGLAKFIDADKDQALSNSFVGGTLEYASPEQLFGQPLKANADLWSVGVLLFELFTGELPFSAADVTGSAEAKRAEIFKQIIQSKIPASIEMCPPPYQAMIKVCLVKDVAYRVAHTSDLVEMLKIKKPKIRIDIPPPSDLDQAGLDGDTIVITENETHYQELLLEAEQARLDDNYERAKEKYEVALTLSKDPKEAIQGLKETEASRLAFDKRQADLTAYHQLLSEADLAASDQQYTVAVSILSKALAIMPDKQGDVELLIQQYKTAQADKKRQEKIDDLLGKADSASKQGQWSEAVDLYHQCVDAGLAKERVSVKIDHAQEQLELERQEVARQENFNAAVVNVKNALAADEMAEAARHMDLVKEYAAAPSDYADLQAQLSKRQSYHQSVRDGEAAASSGDLAAAIAAYEAAATIDSKAADRLATLRTQQETENKLNAEYKRLFLLAKEALKSGDLEEAQVHADKLSKLRKPDADGEQLLKAIATAKKQEEVQQRLAEQKQLLDLAQVAEDGGDLREAVRLSHQAAQVQTSRQGEVQKEVDRRQEALNQQVELETAQQKLEADYESALRKAEGLIEESDLVSGRKLLAQLNSHELADDQLQKLQSLWRQRYNKDLARDARYLVAQRELSAAADLINNQDDQEAIDKETVELATTIEAATALITASTELRQDGKFAEAITKLKEAKKLVAELGFLQVDIDAIADEQREHEQSKAQEEAKKKAAKEAAEQVDKDVATFQQLIEKADFEKAQAMLGSLQSRIDVTAHQAHQKRFSEAVLSHFGPLVESAIAEGQFDDAKSTLAKLDGLVPTQAGLLDLHQQLDEAMKAAEAAALKRQEEERLKANEEERRLKEQQAAEAAKAERKLQQEAAEQQRKNEQRKQQEEAQAKKAKEKAEKQALADRKKKQKQQAGQALALVKEEKWSKAKKALQAAIEADPKNAVLQEQLAIVVAKIEEEKSKRRPLALYLTSGVGLALVLSAIAWWTMRGGETAGDAATVDVGLTEVVVNQSNDVGVADIDRLLSSGDEAELLDFVEIYPSHPRLDEVERRLGIITDGRDDEAFGVARSANTISAYEAYKRTYPEGRHLSEADEAIRIITEAAATVVDDKEAYDLLKQNPSNAAIEQFRKQFPNSRYLAQVDQLEVALQAQYRRADYEAALASPGLTGLRDFLDRYKTGEKVDLAKNELKRRAQKIEKDDWEKALASGRSDDLQRYITRYPNGAFVVEARKRLKVFDEENLWQQIQHRPSLDQAALYLSTYPSGKHIAEVRKVMRSLSDQKDWEVAKATNTEEAYKAYIRDHTDGAYIDQARQSIEDLKPEEVALPPVVKAVEDGLQTIAAGSFTLGCDVSDSKCEKDEMPPRDISMQGIAVAKYEVTQRLWRQVMGSNPSYYAAKGQDGCLRCPVENVSYDEVQRFIKTLNQLPSNPYTYRLPTEAEWEYAATGGRSTVFAGSDDPDEVAVHNNPSGTVKVGSKRPNAYGLYDMSGNVAEWTSTWYSPDAYKDGQTLTGPSTGETKVIRGGSFRDKSARCRVNNRNEMYPDEKEASVGFRLVRSL